MTALHESNNESRMSDTPIIPDLEQLRAPRASAEAVKAQLKFTLLSAQFSSRVGYLLVAIPAAFVGAVVLHYGFGLPLPGFEMLEGVLTYVETHPAVRWVAPLLLVGAPLVSLSINVLAVLHVSIDRRRREVQLTVKLRWPNLIVAVISAFILAVVFAHAAAEAAHHGGN
jgi:hypothetical protein